jgi:Fic family protein
MKRSSTGNYVTISPGGGEKYRAFVPNPLPPDPPLALDDDFREIADQALLALGRLDSMSALLPDTSLFLYMYVRKEAVLSSQIEGTQSSLSDLLLFESEGAPGVPLDDIREVSNYVAAMDHGLARLRGGFPLSLRLIREIHKILLSKGRGSEKEPGQFRRTQNWIGGTRPGNAAFVPPPPESIMECMAALEKFLHNEPVRTPLLIKAALAHVQFETIHPFLDGNGRLGRLLITFILCAEGALAQPMLYLSLYFKTHRGEYYEHLQRVRVEGDWESWLSFFVTGVKETAESAVQTANALVKLFETDRQRIQPMGRIAGSALRVHQALQQSPVVSVAKAAQMTGLTVPTVTASLLALEKAGVARELTGQQRGRLFGYQEYIKILSQGTEPL